MVLKAYKEITFKAQIKFLEDNSVVEATFRKPRQTDYYSSRDGNQSLENLKLIANIFKSFDKPIKVELEDGTQVNVDNLEYLQNLGIPMDISDCLEKLGQLYINEQKEKEELVKKSKSAGNSTKKATTEKED